MRADQATPRSPELYSVFNILILSFFNLHFYKRGGICQIPSFCERSEIGYKEAKLRNKYLLSFTYIFNISKPLQKGFLTKAKFYMVLPISKETEVK